MAAPMDDRECRLVGRVWAGARFLDLQAITEWDVWDPGDVWAGGPGARHIGSGMCRIRPMRPMACEWVRISPASLGPSRLPSARLRPPLQGGCGVGAAVLGFHPRLRKAAAPSAPGRARSRTRLREDASPRQAHRTPTHPALRAPLRRRGWTRRTQPERGPRSMKGRANPATGGMSRERGKAMVRFWLAPGSFQEPGHGPSSLRLGRSLALPNGARATARSTPSSSQPGTAHAPSSRPAGTARYWHVSRIPYHESRIAHPALPLASDPPSSYPAPP